MKKYVINEHMASLPTNGDYHEVEAASYREKATRTIFYGEDGNEVFSMKSDAIKTIRVQPA